MRKEVEALVQLRRQPALRLQPEQLEEPVPILLVSEDRDVAELYRLKLEIDGYRPTVVRSVAEAVVQMPVCGPDIIYFYAGGVPQPAIQAFQALRDHEATGLTPIIVLVDEAGGMDAMRDELRPVDYLVPVDGRRPELGTADLFGA